jgi:hypothetical protein
MGRNDKKTEPPPPPDQERRELLAHADQLTAIINGLVAHRGWLVAKAESLPGGSVR